MTSTLAEGVLAGDPRAMARAISLIEDEQAAGVRLVREIFSGTGRAYLVGVTGPPGAGKSTLVDRVVTDLRRRPSLAPRPASASAGSDEPGPDGVSVGVIAVDPTSPFTGGALLGDRVRMQAHASDPRVFIRSMATRGQLGGLSRATGDAALVLDAAGKDVVLIETVGVGQDEVEIVRTADVSIVVLVPGTGDEVQALKAGVMEIADIFVVNKADRDGADRLAAAVESSLALKATPESDWQPPVLRTVATTGQGIADLVDTVARFRERATRDGPAAAGAAAVSRADARRRLRSESRLRELVAERFMARLERDVLRSGELASLVARIAARELDPYTAADELLGRACGNQNVD